MATIYLHVASLMIECMHAKGDAASLIRFSLYILVLSYTTPFKSRQNAFCNVLNLTNWFVTNLALTVKVYKLPSPQRLVKLNINALACGEQV